jgi:hypothetical protein
MIFAWVWRTRAADEAPSKGAAWLMEAGKTDELIRHLRRCRCELVDAMHESRRRVDRMDTLIRQAEKTNV